MNPTQNDIGAAQTLKGLTNGCGLSNWRQSRTLAILACVLVACFAVPIYSWIRFAAGSELFSYVLLVPVISLYLVWENRSQLLAASRPKRFLALPPLALGLAVLAVPTLGRISADPLTWEIGSFYLFFVAICCLALGTETLKRLSFAIAFLAFIVPLPGFLVNWAETFLQHTSAMTAQAFFALTGMPVFREGLVFQLPGIRLEVAPECSGIHSTLVLLLTSLVAGYLFLASRGRRLIIAVAVVPLGILRNAVRICTIGQLCVHVSPAMINSPIHRRGGPLFFAVSLIPLFLLLYYLRKSERGVKGSPTV